MESDFKETNEKDGSSQSTSQDLIPNSQNIEQSFPALSEYYNSLEPHVKRRYLEKISVVGLDPGTLLDARLDPECLPPIEAMDLFSYLVRDTSFNTKEQFKASKSLESFNFLVSGFITNAQGVKISDKYVVTRKVRHNRRMNNPLLPI